MLPGTALLSAGLPAQESTAAIAEQALKQTVGNASLSALSPSLAGLVSGLGSGSKGLGLSGTRIITGFLGLLLIAAAIFTHPTVINVGKKVGETAAKVGVATA